MSKPFQSYSIASVLKEAKTSLKIQSLVVNSGVHEQAVVKQLELLERNGLAVRKPRGAWALTDERKEAFQKRCAAEFGGDYVTGI